MTSTLPPTIRAAVLHAPNTDLRLEDLTLSDLRHDEVLVRLVATGVCHTDISFMHRPFLVDRPVVLGHEGAGHVHAVGSAVTKLRVGDPVVLSFDACGACENCTHEHPAYCHDFIAHNFVSQRADGSTALQGASGPVRHAFFGQSSFATYSVCRERNAIRLDDDRDLELMGPLGCGFQTGAGAVLNVLAPGPADSIAVFGVGSVGLAAIMAAKAMGAARIIAVDLVDSRLEMAKTLGATHGLNGGREADVVAAIRQITRGGVHRSLDTTANMRVLRQAVEALRPLGLCGFVGGAAAGSELCVDVRDVMMNGKTIRGIIEGDSNPAELIPRLVGMFRRGDFPMDKLVRFYPFEQIRQAIADSESGETIKAVLRMP
ncbi:MAG: NAD(P)-dependent alcohol dehydrogenase [Burkholderiaceae bacterium]|nr:NAD(P)-dependent alcohol dehydrogenase [Burkholderiaceae bacterium]